MNDEYKYGPHGIEAQLCRADFYYRLSLALQECHGNNSPSSIEQYQNMKLSEVVDILAQNGIRMIYIPECHIEANESNK